jgi:hypothetical protein
MTPDKTFVAESCPRQPSSQDLQEFFRARRTAMLKIPGKETFSFSVSGDWGKLPENKIW